MATGIRPSWGYAPAGAMIDPLTPIIALYNREGKIRTSWAQQVRTHLRQNMEDMVQGGVIATEACKEYFVTAHMALCILDDITFYELEGEVLHYEIMTAAAQIQMTDSYAMFKAHLCPSTSDKGSAVIAIDGKRLLVLDKSFISSWRDFKKTEATLLKRHSITATELAMTETYTEVFERLRQTLYDCLWNGIDKARSDTAAVYTSEDDIKYIIQHKDRSASLHNDDIKEERLDYQEIYKDNELYGMF